MKTMYERAKELLANRGVNVNDLMGTTKENTFHWVDEFEDFDIELYDGGAVSTDGKIIVLYPRTEDVLNKAMFEDFLRADGECRCDSAYIENLDEEQKRAYVDPYEIFYVCVCEYWNPEGYITIRDFHSKKRTLNDFLDLTKAAWFAAEDDGENIVNGYSISMRCSTIDFEVYQCSAFEFSKAWRKAQEYLKDHPDASLDFETFWHDNTNNNCEPDAYGVVVTKDGVTSYGF